jgi:predicted small lipoprotein YifL
MHRLEALLVVVSLSAACGNNPPSLPPSDDAQADVSKDTAQEAGDDATSDAAPEVGLDAQTTDTTDDTASDAMDVMIPMDMVDAMVAVDATDAAADSTDVRVPTDVVDAAMDASDVADVSDVTDARTDVTSDVADVSDVADARADVADVLDASDVATDVRTDAMMGSDASVSTRELWVLRVGSGTAALSNAGTAIFIDRRSAADGSMRGAEIALPVSMTGSNFPVVLSGTATSEGALTRSVDGRYVTLAGYGAIPGTATVSTSPSGTAPRVVARIDATGVINSSTALGMAYSANNVRAAVTVNGSAFWVAGTGTVAGIQYKLLGATGEPTSVVSMPANVRVLGIFDNQLYGSASTSVPAPGFYGVFRAGTGTPTAADQTATMLPGFPAVAGVSAYGFSALDRDPSIAGVDTLYLADDRAIASGGGVLRWRLSSAGTWSQDAVFSMGLSSGVRGLTAWIEGTEVRIAAVTGESISRVVLYTDTPGMMPGLPGVVAIAPTNTQFRGVALAPTP